ncbi:L,D-transpeptidase family protein [Sphaerotilus sp.]|uniref:L,D-transpeptidase family protein n=1 Tax=Sphaerotilus sp. TaxID=2093942 RepID=UPI00286E7DF0|nr:L,D-transpeptidase family protein [Sphaerotilus sp.]
MTKLQAHRIGRLLAATLTAGLLHTAGATEPAGLTLFEERVQRQPNDPKALIDLGVALARLGRLAEARQRFDQALRTSAIHALAHDNLLQLQLNMARHAYAAALRTGEVLPPADAGLQWSPAPSTPQPPAPPSAPLEVDAVLAAAPPAAIAAIAMKPDWSAWLRPLLASLVLLALGATAWAVNRRPLPITPAEPSASTVSPPITVVVPEHERAVPEERLIQIYRLIGQGHWARALEAAESLVTDQPRFTLAQLVYGDLLLAHSGVLRGFGRGSAQVPGAQERQIAPLQLEARQRLSAWQQPPPPGTVPRQMLLLPASVRQVVVVDGLRSRLFVLEHRAGQLVPTASLYAAIGRLGVGKQDEGDLRTPLGVYDITGRLDSRQVGDFYGAGALPLSYPNEHDRRLRRTGANIWLHGTRADRHADAPFSSNGCIVLSNADMERLLRDLVPRRTPVIIAERLEWVPPKSLADTRSSAVALAESWRQARMQADPSRLLGLYARSFDNGLQGWAEWQRQLAKDTASGTGRERELLDLTILDNADGSDALFITFREVLRGSASGTLRRQYWARERGQWKIFSEGVLE